MKSTIIRGDCLKELKKLRSNSVDSLVTDPPAGISFMGKNWDADKGGRSEWIVWMESVMRECYRVLKPGAHGLVWALPRTSHWTAMAIEYAGFEVRDCIYHFFGSGFPKSRNVGKGRGTALKPSVECWWMVRKPISEKNVEQNISKWGTGALNIDQCRIGAEEGDSLFNPRRNGANRSLMVGAYGVNKKKYTCRANVNGRWPSHLLLDEVAAQILDLQSGERKAAPCGPNPGKGSGNSFNIPAKFGRRGYAGESGGASRFFYIAKCSTSERNSGVNHLLAWDELDPNLQALTAELNRLLRATSADTTRRLAVLAWNTSSFGNLTTERSRQAFKFTIATASRLITESKTSNLSARSNTSASILDAIRTIEASGLSLAESAALIRKLKRTSTNARTASALGASHALFKTLSKISALARRGNTHPTLKPQKLMRYLIRLVTPEGGTVLDPFTGSGSTGIAAKKLGHRFIGIEREKEYVSIARRRIQAA